MNKVKISLCNLNQEKPKTCGSCKHTQNELGLFALHCDMWIEHKKLPPNISKDDSKVRSWEKCCKFYEKIAINKLNRGE
jgi:hypothetical protein